jgi:hypothetical protein
LTKEGLNSIKESKTLNIESIPLPLAGGKISREIIGFVA